jgi:alginate O-acetyltransferase complex protein AlgI
LVLFSYHVFPGKKNIILMMASLVFYAFGEPIYIVLLIFSSTADYHLSKMIHNETNSSARKRYLIISVVMNIGLLCFFKYSDLLIDTVNAMAGLDIKNLNVPLPIGISFYTFQTLSYTVDVYRKNVKPQEKYSDFLLYISMFFQLIAGPIVRYADIEKQLGKRKIGFGNIDEGARRFIAGLGKKVLLGDQLFLLHNQLMHTNGSVVGYWVSMAAYGLHIYYDFSGYSDMAIGLARMFGFRLLENFNYPYVSKSISEFWRRWHISLGNWFKNYVYFSLGGSRNGKSATVRNLLVVWLLTGLWHGASWNYMLWGLYFGIFIILEKTVAININIPKIMKHVYVLTVVIFGWVLFAFESVHEQLVVLKGMIGFDTELINNEVIFYLNEYSVVMILGLICSFMGTFKWNIPKQVKTACYLAVLVASVGFIADGSYSPFIYFRF